MERLPTFVPAGRFRAFVYGLLWACADVSQKFANACLYVAVGVLRREDLRAAARMRWRQFGTVFDEVEAGLDASERRLYSDVLQPSDRVLLVGSGTGRDLIALAELGYTVTGIDHVPELNEMARRQMARRGLNAMVVEGLIEDIDFSSDYDAVVFSLGMYSCLTHSPSRIAALSRIRRHLSAQGRVVISYAPVVPHSRWPLRLMRWSARVARTDWAPEQGDVLSRDHLVRHCFRYEHLLTQEQVAADCAAAGLRVVRDGVMASGLRYAVAETAC